MTHSVTGSSDSFRVVPLHEQEAERFDRRRVALVKQHGRVEQSCLVRVRFSQKLQLLPHPGETVRRGSGRRRPSLDRHFFSLVYKKERENDRLGGSARRVSNHGRRRLACATSVRVRRVHWKRHARHSLGT